MATASEELRRETVTAFKVAAKLGTPLEVWTVVEGMPDSVYTNVFFDEGDAFKHAVSIVRHHMNADDPDFERRFAENKAFLKNQGIIEFDNGKFFVQVQINEVQ